MVAAAKLFQKSKTPGAKSLTEKLKAGARKGSAARLRAVDKAADWCLINVNPSSTTATRVTLPTTTTSPPTTTTTAPKFSGLHFEGVGDGVADFTIPSGEIVVVRISSSGRRNIIVKSYNAQGVDLDLLVNSIGAYDGTRPLNFESNKVPTRIGVEHDGAWTIDIGPLRNQPRVDAPGRFDGNGDQVLISNGKTRTAKFDAAGASRNFIVWGYGTTSDLLVNTIAPYTGVVVVPTAASMVFDVRATGPWAIELS